MRSTQAAMRRARPTMALAVLLVLAMLPSAAVAAPLPGGSGAATPQGDDRSPGVGPGILGIEHLTDIQGVIRDGDDNTLAIRDAQGHLVVNASRVDADDNRTDTLLAIEPSDGTIAWEVPGVAAGCLPVASDTHVYAVVTADSPAAPGDTSTVVELDPADGSVVRAFSGLLPAAPGDTPDRGVPECDDELGLAGDTLVMLNRRSFDTWLTAFDIGGTDITVAWEDYFDGWEGNFVGRPTFSTDGTRLYIVHAISFSEDEGAFLTVYDTATGTEVESRSLPDVPAYLVAVPDGVVVALGNSATNVPRRLVRYGHDASGANLAETWNVVYERDQATDESGLGAWVDRLSVHEGVIVTIESGGDPVIGIDLDTGMPLWDVPATPGFAVGPGTIDAQGTFWYTTSSGDGTGLSGVDVQTGELVSTTGEPAAFWSDRDPAVGQIAPIADDGRVLLLGRLDALQVASIVNGTQRLEAETPLDVAIQICRLLFPAEGSAGGIVLAQDEVFADALAGAPLAGDDACILYTGRGEGVPLDPDTRAEIQRALAPGGRIELLGGESAVSAEAAAELSAAGYDVIRYAGPSRVETAVLVAEEVLFRNPGATEVLLATANNFPDSVLGGSFGGAVGVPIVLTAGPGLHPETDALIRRRGITTTTILGGEGVVSASAAAASPNPTRVAGPNRFATGVAIAAELWPRVIGNPAPRDREFVVVDLSNERSGDAWTYALASAPLAVRRGAPQLGVEPTRLPSETGDYLAGIGFPAPPGLLVVGGVAVVGEQVVTAIQSAAS